MSEARQHILTTIRRGLRRGALDSKRQREMDTRLANPPRNLIPVRAQKPHDQQIELFVQMAQEAAATLDQVATMEQVPAAIASFLEREHLPARIVMAPRREWATLSWPESLCIEQRAAQDGDKTSVGIAFAGIAETGTLVLLSGADSPTTLNFLPDSHIVVLPADQIMGSYEDSWAALRAHRQGMPRTVNFITGPSRSADIEQKLQMGAHGPLRLHIILVTHTAKA